MTKKALSLPILLSLVIGNLIGTGIYVLPASLAEYGTLSLLAWVFTSLGALLLALTFANLSKRVRKTGGPYIYCKEAYGSMVGFMVAYTYWIGNAVAIAGITVASIGYMGYITPLLDANHPDYNKLLALGIELFAIWLFTFINILGVHTAGIVQLILTSIKLLPLLIITVMGASHVEWQNLSSFTPSGESSLVTIGSAAALTFWAFIGLEAATVPAENTKNYKAIYLATVFGTLITALIYIVCTIVLMGMIPVTELKSSQFPFAEAGKLLFGSQAGFVIALCAVISGLGALNVCILIQGQIVFAAARDQLFPRLFTNVSRRDVPVAAQLLSTMLVSAFLVLTMEPTLLEQFNQIALLAGVFALINYFLTASAELKFLMASDQPLKKIFFTKSAIVATLACLYSLWMISVFNLKLLIICTCIMILCVPIYYGTVRRYAYEG